MDPESGRSPWLVARLSLPAAGLEDRFGRGRPGPASMARCPAFVPSRSAGVDDELRPGLYCPRATAPQSLAVVSRRSTVQPVAAAQRCGCEHVRGEGHA